MSCNGEQVTIENDLDNEQQTLHFPILSTTAKGKVSGKNYVDIGGDMSIIDTIKYEGVQYGMTHVQHLPTKNMKRETSDMTV